MSTRLHDERTAAPPRASGLRPGPLLVGVVAFLAASTAGLLVGAVDLPVRAVLFELLDRLPGVRLDSGLTPLQQNLLLEIRLPRVLAAGMVGGLLAIAGAGYQGVFRNPLADPYLLGAAAGAGVGATATIVLLPGDPAATVPVAAFVGALAGVALASALGRVAGGRGTATLLLAGVAVSAFLGAVQTFLMQRDAQDLQRIYSWVLGGVASADGPRLWAVLPYAVVSAMVLLLHGRLLDVLGVGDEEATALGLSARRVRILVLAAASLATAAAVALGGLIGFVGIVVPHVVRRLAGASYRAVLPLSLLAGAAFLVLADVLARTAVAPGELPLGVVTAFVGGPFFVVVLRSMRGRGGL
ncbi:ABC transporter permease [Tsukamurella pulmonis]|uniref:Iron complex transport system permease protein n=1 Tax=Tsukamurella pulmonis TaxID=47312 RepID=A0A1H1DKH0_9ACTN|nr:iron ABC transporter permease [Tsukamurella pulmonis]KXO92316.1 ABC transporter permease [Tsukamurella pulmonis]BDD83334.1 ABC transporter permease [Tsukamurella pulmonis]SDQ76386.1 iron complex transport system permease protein [Tsukamurella pulmonis]SUP22020.1 Iron-uptake system permease protein FeuC [Tsukamurella pulmonis]